MDSSNATDNIPNITVRVSNLGNLSIQSAVRTMITALNDDTKMTDHNNALLPRNIGLYDWLARLATNNIISIKTVTRTTGCVARFDENEGLTMAYFP